MYFAISGAGGIGKTTTLTWLVEHFRSEFNVVALPDFFEPPNLDWPIEEIILYLTNQKIKRNTVINDYKENGVLVFADRTYLDPLVLAMTLLSKEKWKEIDELYTKEKFIQGIHILLVAPHSVIRDRRIGRGSSPQTTWLKYFNISQAQYEDLHYRNWIKLHKDKNIPFWEIDYSSSNQDTNRERLLEVIKPLVISTYK